MRRLYSTFPGGWPGMGLLLLRVAVGVTLIIQGSAYLPELQNLKMGPWVVCLLALASGAALLMGLLTPVAGFLAAGTGLGVTLLYLPTTNGQFFYDNPLSLDVIIMAMVCALLGPGAFSMDARLFGRRKIIIPRTSPSHAPSSAPSRPSSSAASTKS